ncbi:NAD(P)H-binding protein [Bacillus sp. BRMEA1]|uniref:NAD(P)H-binding protein n=1 Tax=Neobacillus endophyticus TaxID=2738405 RepID=UPI00156540AC|nr:NAD(P)H-binding protein [Neobacillus endophyticus]NRD76827.1 NAD(P)H-binding protein [Neobacillus endophyticus]
MDHPYKIALIGGTGKVGRFLASEALKNGFQVRMLVRSPNKIKICDDKMEVVKGDVVNIEAIKQLLEGCHIVINCFGQRMRDTPIYSRVTSQILKVMKEKKMKRYIGVTGASLTIKGDKKSLLNRIGATMFEVFFSKMIINKKEEFNILLENQDLDWTLIRLPFVREAVKSNPVKVSFTDMPGSFITNKEIASFIISQMDNKAYIHKTPFIAS